MIKNVLSKLFGPPTDNGTNGSKYNSRRYKTMWVLTILLFLVLVVPPTLTYIMTVTGVATLQFMIMGESAFVTVITLIWGAYLASDYGTKRLGQYGPEPEEENYDEYEDE